MATATTWLSASEMRAWRNFIESVGTMTSAMESDLAPFGLTMGDYEVLVRLSEAPDERLRMCDLATALQLSPSGLTRRLDGLVTSGLVERIASPTDRRVMFAALTAKGHAKLVEAAPDHVASVRNRFFKGLSRDQVHALGEIFETVRANLNSVPGMTALPAGFRTYVANAGIKDSTNDFVVVATDAPCTSAGVFTTSSFAGPSVLVSREHLESPTAQAVVVISKNANVATGEEGLANAREVVAGVATALGCEATDVLIASTGVIGRQYPMDRVRRALATIPSPMPYVDAGLIAAGIMTTDTVPKLATASVGDVRIVGVAKGVGMIEPNMATLITLLFTDADISADDLDPIFRRVIDRTFNCVSIDTDTSTSDTAIVMASGAAGPIDLGEFEQGLYEVALSLTKQVARDGEGAEKLIEVRVAQGQSAEQVKRVAKAIVNSPLVKTAVHGADPNWGRVAMAIGKSTTAAEVDQSKVVILFGDQEVYPSSVDATGLDALAQYMRGDEVRITAVLGTGDASATVWGCDLTDGYVRINADYTT